MRRQIPIYHYSTRDAHRINDREMYITVDAYGDAWGTMDKEIYNTALVMHKESVIGKFTL